MKKILIVLAVAFFALHSAFWFYGMRWLDGEMTRLFASSGDVQFLGPKPVISGYPLLPTAVYTGGFTWNRGSVTFDEMTVRGYPLPFFPMTVTFEKGLSANMDFLPVLTPDFVQITFAVPPSLPADTDVGSMRAWKDAGGKIDIRDAAVIHKSLRLRGNGIVTLDDELQPNAALSANLQGWSDYVVYLQEQQMLKPGGAMLALTVLNGLSTIEPEGEQPMVTLSMRLTGRMLWVGPIQVAQVPKIVWGTRNPPAPHQ